MTDFEVNKRLAELELGENWWWKYSTVLTEKLVPTDSGGFETRKTATDYCRNWSDIGPLIEKYDLSIIKVSDGFIAVEASWDYIDLSGYDEMDGACIGCDCVIGNDKNPKRAAALCIIKLLESQL